MEFAFVTNDGLDGEGELFDGNVLAGADVDEGGLVVVVE